eukprot:6197869-Amphidinium_carterae.1
MSACVKELAAHLRVVAESVQGLVTSVRSNQASGIGSVLPLLTGGPLPCGGIHELATHGKSHRVVANDKAWLSGKCRSPGRGNHPQSILGALDMCEGSIMACHRPLFNTFNKSVSHIRLQTGSLMD